MMRKSMLPIIFIHKGDSDYLEYTLRCCKIFNPDSRVVLLGDEINQHHRNIGIEHFLYTNYQGEELNLFQRVFQVIQGKDNKSKEWIIRFWFQRWFHIFYFINTHQINQFWTFDSDNLILCDLSSKLYRFREYDCTEQCNGMCINGFVGNSEVVKGYINTINKLFHDREYLAQQRQEYEEYTNWAFTEMAAYAAYKKSVDIKTKRLNSIIEGEIFDDCICQEHEMEMIGGIKKLYVDEANRTFYVKHLPTQQYIKLNSINMSWVPTSFIKQVFEDATISGQESISSCEELSLQGVSQQSQDQLSHEKIQSAVEAIEGFVRPGQEEYLFNVEVSLLPFNLRSINFIIFPDWSKSEVSLGAELEEIIRVLAAHPEKTKIALLIESSKISEEEAHLILCGIALNLLMKEDLDVTTGPEISLLGQLYEVQWKALLPRIYGKVILENENIKTLPNVESISSYTLDEVSNKRIVQTEASIWKFE